MTSSVQVSREHNKYKGRALATTRSNRLTRRNYRIADKLHHCLPINFDKVKVGYLTLTGDVTKQWPQPSLRFHRCRTCCLLPE